MLPVSPRWLQAQLGSLYYPRIARWKSPFIPRLFRPRILHTAASSTLLLRAMPDDLQQRRHRGVVSRAGTAYVRTRTAAACQVCRARRVKCDNERPCSNCRRIGATCSNSPESPTAGFDPASLAILSKLEDLRNEVKSLSGRSHRSHDAPVDHPPANNSISLRLDHHLQRGNLRQVLAWDVWQPRQPPRGLASGVVGYVTQSPPGSKKSTASDLGLRFELFPGYLDDFFCNVHILNPVLDEVHVRGQLTNFLLHGIGWDAHTYLLLLILANGACSSAYPQSPAQHASVSRDEERLTNAQALFDAAEKRRDTLWRADYLTQARCYFYSGIFMMVLLRPFEAWRYFLDGLATCQSLTALSHRHGARDPSGVENQAEESIYWSCWKSERELRFELDMPDFSPMVFDHPVMFPTLPQASDQGELRAWYFYLAEISLWRFEMTARQSMSDFVKADSSSLESLAQRVTDLDETLVSWRDSLPHSIRLDTSGELDSNDLLLFVLKGRLTYNYEVLTWPFLETLILFGEHGCTKATELAVRGLCMHHERLTINRPGFFHRHHGTWLMRSSSVRSACVLLAAAQSSISGRLPTDWLELVSDTVNMLEFWNEEPYSEVIVFLRSILADFIR